MKKIVYGIAAALSFSSAVNAATAQGYGQGQGQVNFKGVVIDAPCGIAPESADQTIDFGQLSKAHLEQGGISHAKNLDIKLVNCYFTEPSKTVKATFTGNTVTSHPEELATAGGTGTAIMVSGQNENPVKFDGSETSGAMPLKNGDNTLHYTAWVKKSSAADSTVTEGEFSSVVNFNLSYQ
ncbi:TPA: type 1 fimbrial protein [Escherichia coli]|nr:type 1 fimbrial protein [Escherichia coli]